MARRNLILVHRGIGYERDFSDIMDRIDAIDPSIAVFSLPAQLKTKLPTAEWRFPTLTVSLISRFMLPVRRGPVLRNVPANKFEQQQAFRNKGIPTPPAMSFAFGKPLDPIMFGEFVVLKPSDLNKTSHGDSVFLFRRKRLAALSHKDLPEGHPLNGKPGNYIVQRFIDTGPQPCHYRVQLLFGEVLYCWKQTLNGVRPPLDASDAEIESAIVASQGGERNFVLSAEEDVLALGARVYEAFPNTPLLGVDIVREQPSGRLFVLECNPGGNTWHFSSSMGKTCRAVLGGAPERSAKEADAAGRLALINQFGAFDRAAQVLARKTAELAS
jgi:hypothetical protein